MKLHLQYHTISLYKNKRGNTIFRQVVINERTHRLDKKNEDKVITSPYFQKF